MEECNGGPVTSPRTYQTRDPTRTITPHLRWKANDAGTKAAKRLWHTSVRHAAGAWEMTWGHARGRRRQRIQQQANSAGFQRCHGCCNGGSHGRHRMLGQWKSGRQVGKCATPALDREWEFPALLPWPPLDGSTIIHTTTNMEVWPMALMGGEASARASPTAPIPIVMSDSSSDSDDGLLGTTVPADGAWT